MSGSVYVLAVMDHVRSYVKSEARFLEVRSFDEACAAVAELIAKADEVQQDDRDAATTDELMDEFRAAIARVKGD